MKKIIFIFVIFIGFSSSLRSEEIMKNVVVNSEISDDTLILTAIAFIDTKEYTSDTKTKMHLRARNDELVYSTDTERICDESINAEYNSTENISCSKYLAKINLSDLNLKEGFYDVVVEVTNPKDTVKEILYANINNVSRSFYYDNLRYDIGIKENRAYIDVVNEQADIKTDVTEYKVEDNLLVLHGVGYLNKIPIYEETQHHQVIVFKDINNNVVYKHEAKTVRKPFFMWLYSNKLRDHSYGFFESQHINLSSLRPGKYSIHLYVFDNNGNFAQEQLYTSHIPSTNTGYNVNISVENNRLFLIKR